MNRRALSLLLTLLGPLACQRAEAAGPQQVRSPQQIRSPLEDEARRHLWAIWTAEKAYYGERMTYSEQARQIGFEPDPWCPDGARLAINPPPADPRQALGCHFIYELNVSAAGDRWTAAAHGFGPAAGIELTVDQVSPRPALQKATAEASLGAEAPSGWQLSQQSLTAEALDDLHLLYMAEKRFFAGKAQYSSDPAALIESLSPPPCDATWAKRQVPDCPAGSVAPRPSSPEEVGGCDFVYTVRVTGTQFQQRVSFRAHGVGRAAGLELAVDIGGDREGIPYVPSRQGPVQAR